MEHVYVITTGSYSDYRIIAVFDDKGMADEFSEQYGYDVEVFGINQPRQVPEGMFVFIVDITEEGMVIGVIKDFEKLYLVGEYAVFSVKLQGGITTYANFILLAKSEEHAVKIASERRAILLVTERWIPGEGYKVWGSSDPSRKGAYLLF